MPAGWWSDVVDRSLFAVQGAPGRPVGVGFLVAADIVATCAHVVEAATRAAGGDGTAGEGTAVRLWQPLTAAGRDAVQVAVVERWARGATDGTDDVALLRLAEVPVQARAIRLVEAGDLWGHPVRTFGFPARLDGGVWHEGRLRGRQGDGWLQVDPGAGGHPIERGFSGAPVWDAELAAVVGMVVAADTGAARAGYVIPTGTLLLAWPELRRAALPPSPYRGLLPFREADRDLFFGRDAATAQLLDRLRGTPVLTVLGPSGSGKSSLVQAGAVPELRAGGADVAVVRPADGTAPLSALAAALVPLLDPDLPALDRLDEQARLGAIIADGRLADVVAEILRSTSGTELVVVLDQAEQLLDLEPAATAPLLDALLPDRPPDRLRVVLTLRSDHLDAALAHPGLSRALGHGLFLVVSMTVCELESAVAGPIGRLGGVDFERGLVERIVADAGTDPGGLPLLGNVLTLLWLRQDGGVLTHAAYESVGGIGGSLARYADQVWHGLPADEQATARRVLLGLVRVSPDGQRATRRASTAEQLGEERWTVAQRLVRARLLVAGQDAGQDADARPTVEIAHDALIDRWPLLHDWLTEDRDFLSWRADLERQRELWQSATRDPDMLLRGTALATAAVWSERRAPDLGATAVEFVRRSQDRQRRTVRRWRIVTALLTVLLLAAGVLAAVALDRGNRLAAQLAAANAESLGGEALAREIDDPVAATQLALAAWRANPTNPTARAALSQRYTAMRSVEAVFPELAPNTITELNMSTDGDVALLRHDAGTTAVIGLVGGAPESWLLPRAPVGSDFGLSPDGRYAAAVDPGGAVLVWDLPSQRGPTTLFSATSGGVAGGFSADGTRFVAVTAAPGGFELSLRDVAGAGPVVPPATFASTATVTGAWVTDDPGLVVVRDEPVVESLPTERLTLRSVADGSVVRRLPADTGVVQHGSSVLTCVDNADPAVQDMIIVSAADSGVERTRFPTTGISGCAGLRVELTADGNHVIRKQGLPDEPQTYGRVTSLATGATYDVTLPTGAAPTTSQPIAEVPRDTAVAAVDGPDGTLTVLVSRRSSLLRLSGGPPLWAGGVESSVGARVSDDGRYLVTSDGSAVVTRDRTTGQPLGRLDVRGEADDVALGVTDVSDAFRRLIRSSQTDGWTLIEYGLPSLARTAEYGFPSPPDTGPPASASVVDDGDRLYALIGRGHLLSVWDKRSHQMIGEPQRIGPPRSPGQTPGPEPGLQLRPGHDGQLLTTSTDGRLVLWSTRENREIGTVSAGVAPDSSSPFAFDATGSRLAVLTPLNTIELWDVDADRRLRPPVAAPGVGKILDFAADGTVATSDRIGSGNNAIQFWDLERGRSGALLLPVGAEAGGPIVDGRRVLIDTFEMIPMELATTGQGWFDALCAAHDREFTGAEREVLPEGVDADPPCRG